MGRKWTPEQRQAASERFKQRAATAVMEQSSDAGPTDDSDVLTQLARTLMQAASKKANQKKVLDDLGRILDQIDPKAHPELAEDPTIQAFVEKIGGARIQQAQARGMPPGTVVGTGMAAQALPWTLNDVVNLVKNEHGEPVYVTFTPTETTPVFFNGVRCQLIADEEVTIPKAFYDLYQESRRLTRLGEQHKAYMMGKSSYLPPKLAAEGEAAVATARVRAFMDMGGQRGGGSILVGTDGLDRREPAGGENAGASEQS